MTREDIEMSERKEKLRKRPWVVRGLMLLLILSAGLICSTPAFAEDEASEDGPEMVVIVGENGTVNGHREDFALQTKPGEDITLVLRGDAGYVVDQVLINDDPLEEEDMTGIAGKQTADLKLEGIDSSLSVEVKFAQGETGVGNDENSEETEEGEPSVDEGTTDAEKEDPAETEQMTEPSDGKDGENPDGNNETGASKETDAQNEGEGDAPDKDKSGAPGKEENDSPDEDAGDAPDTNSPRTGDPISLIVFLLFTASATMIGIVCCGRLWRRRGRTHS